MKVLRRTTGFLLLVLATSPLITQHVKATTIDPLIWQQLVAHSEFVGVVECTTAGGIVARYKVIESLKGPKAGTEFTVKMAVNFWGPQFPVTFVGERYFMTGFKVYAPTRIMSTTSGTGVPLWWRQIPSDYRLPLWQGRVGLPIPTVDQPLYPLGSEHKDFPSFQKAVQQFLAFSATEQELKLLQALSAKYIFKFLDSDRSEKGDPQERAHLKELQLKVEGSAGPRNLVLHLLDLAKKYEKARYSVRAVLEQGGGRITLETFESSAVPKEIWKAEEVNELITEIKFRLNPTPPESREAVTDRVPDKQQLDKLRTAIAVGTESPDFEEAFDVLTKHDPSSVATFLTTWKNPERQWQDTDAGYLIGSYFAWQCGKDRDQNLRTLLSAQDPFIRVAGAVYLTFEDRDFGFSKLQELMELPGDPGVWAALNLASRGNKNAVERALEVFSTAGARGHMSSVPHENLQLRLLILLSNSAAASKLEQPRPSVNEPGYDASEEVYKSYVENVRRYYTGWWQANKDKITLSDPWRETLDKQKVD